jgi:hypothetical protein
MKIGMQRLSAVDSLRVISFPQTLQPPMLLLLPLLLLLQVMGQGSTPLRHCSTCTASRRRLGA